MSKSTNAEIEKRLLEVYTMLCKAYTYTEIVRYCTDKYSITSREVDKYIKKATSRLIDENKKNAEQLRAEANNRYLSWIRNCEKEGKYRDCAYIQSRMDKINGLETSSVDVNITNLDKKRDELLTIINGNVNDGK